MLEHTSESTGSARRTATGLIAAGGIFALLSYATHWAKFTYPQTAISSVSVFVGHRDVGLIFGVLLLLRAIMTWKAGPAQARRWGGFAIVSGGFIAGYAIYDLTTEKTRLVSSLVSNTAAHLSLPVIQVRSAIDQQVAVGMVKVTFLGVYLALVAAALAVAGGIVSLRLPRDQPVQGFMPERLAGPADSAPPVAPPPPHEAGWTT